MSTAVSAQGSGTDHRATRTVGGTQAANAAHPTAVALLEKGNGSAKDCHFCGRSVLSSDLVVTAAHCVEGMRPGQVEAVSGRTMRSDAPQSPVHTVAPEGLTKPPPLRVERRPRRRVHRCGQASEGNRSGETADGGHRLASPSPARSPSAATMAANAITERAAPADGAHGVLPRLLKPAQNRPGNGHAAQGAADAPPTATPDPRRRATVRRATGDGSNLYPEQRAGGPVEERHPPVIPPSSLPLSADPPEPPPTQRPVNARRQQRPEL
ncbi:trypsin-like serine protease [Streptomyces sp. SAS_270]|uniref:trypsin-like serine protease n=1 Tax=Streptomyces sp. SAS_270 TaxID=3412748 RepID=UPI00403C62CA